MASFRSDAQGFLVGELVTGTRDILRSQQQGMSVWKAIRADVKSIARAVNVQVATVARVSQSSARAPSGPRAVATPLGRASSSVSRSGQSAASSRSGGSPSRSTAVAVPVQRSANGRFVAGQKRGGEPGSAPGAGGAVGAGSFKSLSESIGKLSGALSAADNVDPTINAMKEVTDVVSPLGRGLFSMFGRTAERKKERWYGRFLKALTGRASGATGSGGGGSSGGGVAGTIGGSLAGRAAGGLVGAAGGLLGKGAGMLKGGLGMLKRVPVLGALLSGGLALGSAFGMNDDPTKSDEENRNTRYRSTGEAAGMGIGGIAGGALGSLLGPAGTIGGAYLGSLIGEKVGGAVGDWSKQLMDSDVPGKMLAKWDAITSALGSAWQTTTKKAGEVWAGAKSIAGSAVDTVKAGATAVNTGVKNTTEKDVGEWAGAAGSAVVSTAKTMGAAVVPETVKRAAGAIGRAGSNAGLMLQAGRDAGMGNRELANFMGQNAHESGGFTTLKENTNFTPEQLLKNFKGRNGGMNTIEEARAVHAGGQGAIGEAIYGGAWGKKNLGNTEEGDGLKFKGRGFTQITGRSNYAAAGKDLGLDLVNNPALAEDPQNAARISAWYWKKRVAPKGAGEDVTMARKAINGGLNGLDDTKKKAAEWETKIAGGYGGASVTTAGALPAANSSGATVVVASLPSVPASNVPSSVPLTLPAMPDTPAPATPLNSGAGAGRGVVTVRMPDQTGQNIGDRAIAHVVSGGLGAV